MISYEADPSLHTTAPEEPSLDDGFSRPHAPQGTTSGSMPVNKPETLDDFALAEKSPF